MGYKNKKITPKKSKRVWIILAVILLLVGAFLAYRQLSSDDSFTANQNQTATGDLTTQTDEEQVPTEITPDKSLYVENERYKIRYDERSDTYTITLYAIINNPSQYESYKAELKEFKQEALRYLTDKSVNIEKAKIVYEPEEATNL